MKKIITLAIVAFTANLAIAQTATIERSVVANGGTYAEAPSYDISLSSTIGQAIFTTVGNSQAQIVLTQGFQQPDFSNATGVQTVTAQGINMNVYPNPFNSEFFTVINLDKEARLNFNVTDIAGRTIALQQQVNHPAGQAVYTFNTASLAQGMYTLTVRTEDGKFVQTVKLTKAN